MEKIKDATIYKIVNEQFKIIGVNLKYEDIPDDGEIEVGEGKKKRKIKWYDLYKFKDEEEYMRWKKWAKSELDKVDIGGQMAKIDMNYGLNYLYPVETGKGEQISLFTL